jgi:hypothetical protein
MNHILVTIEILCLSVIVGGGIVLGGGLRPQFMKAMKQSKAVHELETLHINSWHAYNRFSFLAVIILIAAQIIFSSFQVYPLTLSITLLLLFLTKIKIDAKLRKRSQENDHAAVQVEQRKDHKKVEILSIIILLLSAAGLFLIY